MYYQRRNEDGIKQARVKHVGWIIQNRPDHPIAGLPFCSVDKQQYQAEYLLLKELWLKQVKRHSRTPAILANAAEFFVDDDMELSERLFLNALKIEPNSRYVRGRLAQLYSHWAGHEQQADAERERVCKFDQSLNLSPGNGNLVQLFNELMSLPSMTFEAGEIEIAVNLASRLLELARKHRKYDSSGSAINEAHTVLGRVALKSGNLDKARFHLEQSASTSSLR